MVGGLAAIQPEGRAQLVAEILRAVPAYGQPAAVRRARRAEGRYHGPAPGDQALAQSCDVSPAVFGRGQEVEGSPVVPDVERARELGLGYVGGDPVDPLRALTEPVARTPKRGFGDVEDRETLEARVEKTVDEDGGPPADVDRPSGGPVAAGVDHEPEREGRVELEPAELRVVTLAVDRLPMPPAGAHATTLPARRGLRRPVDEVQHSRLERLRSDQGQRDRPRALVEQPQALAHDDRVHEQV